MPSSNPKHRKVRATPEKMGLKKKAEQCLISGCSNAATHHLALINVTEYATKLHWTIDPKKKTRRAALCKKHYKEYKKQRDKDEKYTKMRDFNPRNSSKPKKTLEQIILNNSYFLLFSLNFYTYSN